MESNEVVESFDENTPKVDSSLQEWQNWSMSRACNPNSKPLKVIPMPPEN